METGKTQKKRQARTAPHLEMKNQQRTQDNDKTQA